MFTAENIKTSLYWKHKYVLLQVPYKTCLKYIFTRKLLTVSGDTASCHGRPRLGYHGKPGQLHCDYCNQVFSYPSAMENHIRIHTGEKPFKCGICDKTFAQKSSLNKHLLTHSNTSRPTNQFEMNTPASVGTTRTPKHCKDSPLYKLLM